MKTNISFLSLICISGFFLIQCSVLNKTGSNKNEKKDPSELSLEHLKELQTTEQNIKILTLK